MNRSQEQLWFPWRHVATAVAQKQWTKSFWAARRVEGRSRRGGGKADPLEKEHRKKRKTHEIPPEMDILAEDYSYFVAVLMER